MPTLILASFSIVVAWVVWRITRNLFIRSPLDNVPGPSSGSYIKGHLPQLFAVDGWEFINGLGTKYNKVVKLNGLMGHRMLYVFDPTALHQIILKDSEVYENPEWSLESMRMTMGPGLLGVHGARHRKQRKMLNPVFSIKHMRSMTPLFYTIVNKMVTGIGREVGNDQATVNILDWFGRTALELIGQCGLGTSLDTLEEPEPNPLGDAVKEFLPAAFTMSEFQFLLKYAKDFGPGWFRAALIDLLPVPGLQRIKGLVNKIASESVNVLAQKRAALKAGDEVLLKQVGEGKDIMSILLRANMAASEEDRLPDDELLGQMCLLVLAGTDTTSNAMTTMTDLLARNAAIQDKLRAEIVEAQAKYGSEIPYDELVALPYMDAICRETLRLYPPGMMIWREAQKDNMLQLSQPIIGVDGQTLNEIFVPAGTSIMVAIRAVNRDRSIWGDDALEFKPERWLSPLPPSVTEARIPGVYSNLMTFNGGGRACIGFKFSQLEMKVVLTTLISKFKVSLAENADEVEWNASAVRYPSVGKSGGRPEYPIKLKRIRV